MIYSSNPYSELNTARWLYELARTMWRYANKGFGSKSSAARQLNIARGRLFRAITGRKKAKVYDADYEMRVCGIPCGVIVTYYSGPQFNNWGHPDDREPDEPEDIEFFLVDRNGYPASWLERRVCYDDLRREVLDLHRGV